MIRRHSGALNPREVGTKAGLAYRFEIAAGGSVQVQVRLTKQPTRTPFRNFDATMSLPSAGISDLKVPLQKAGPGHFLAYGFDIPLRGTWKLQMMVRTTNIDEFDADPVTVHIH